MPQQESRQSTVQEELNDYLEKRQSIVQKLTQGSLDQNQSHSIAQSVEMK